MIEDLLFIQGSWGVGIVPIREHRAQAIDTDAQPELPGQG
jgi:hypothetical protein